MTLITPLFGIVHFKTNYNYRLSNHCFINELILVTYALISNAVENTHIKGRLLFQAMISTISLFKMGTSLKGKNLLPEGANSFL